MHEYLFFLTQNPQPYLSDAEVEKVVHDKLESRKISLIETLIRKTVSGMTVGIPQPGVGTLLRARCPTERGRAPHYP